MALWKAKLTIAAMAAVALFSASAQAQNCEDLPNPIYIAGSSASQPVWTHVGPILFDAGTTIVYQNQGSCTGVTYIETNASDPTSTVNGVSGTGIYFPGTSADGGTSACTISPAGGATVETVNVGISDVFESTCDVIGASPGSSSGFVGNFNGPTQAMLSPAAPRREHLHPRDLRRGGLLRSRLHRRWNGLSLGPDPGEQLDRWHGVSGHSQFQVRHSIHDRRSHRLCRPPSSPGYGRRWHERCDRISALESRGHGKRGQYPQSYLGIAVAGNYDTQRTKLQALAFRGYGQALRLASRLERHDLRQAERASGSLPHLRANAVPLQHGGR